MKKNILNIFDTIVAQGNKTGGKMTLFVDAAIAAVNSSIATNSVKQLAAVLTHVL